MSVDPVPAVVGIWRTCIDSPTTCTRVGGGYEFLADGTWRAVSSGLADAAPTDRFCYRPGRMHGTWSTAPSGIVMEVNGHAAEIRFRVLTGERASFLRGGQCEHLRRVDATLNRGVCKDAEAPCSDDSECHTDLCEHGRCVSADYMEPPGILSDPRETAGAPCE